MTGKAKDPRAAPRSPSAQVDQAARLRRSTFQARMIPSLQNAIEMGRSLGAYLPEDIMVVGIATRRIYDFSEERSPPVAEAIPQAVRTVLDLLKQHAVMY